MVRKIRMVLDGLWVLRHKDDELMPVAAVKQGLGETKGLETGRDTFASLEVLFDDKLFTFEQARDALTGCFARLYPSEEDRAACSVELVDKTGDAGPASGVKLGHGGDWTDPDGKDVLDEETASAEAEEAEEDKEEGRDELDDPALRELLEEIGREASSKASAARTEELHSALQEAARRAAEACDDTVSSDGGKTDAVMAEIEGLIGAKEYKALARELVRVAPAIVKRESFPVFLNRTYLFSIGDGCGLTTYLRLLARLIPATGLRKLNGRVNEVKLEPFKDSMEPFSAARSALERGIMNNGTDVLLIDISEWIDRTDNANFRRFLREAERAVEDYVVVFRVPFVEKDVLETVRRSLEDLLSVQTVSFPPFSGGEIREYAKRSLAKFNFRMSARAWGAFDERIAEEKRDGRFYGLNTVDKVVRELIYTKQLADCTRKHADDTVSLRDAKALCTLPDEDSVPALQQLDRLVGCESVKRQLLEIVAQIELAKKSSAARPCIHMRFVGNPGTGKTTVARILGKLLREKGLLRIGRFYEYAGRDFCGQYIGETAPKTASICRDAYGSVLFIDEAYSLYRGANNEKDYGREAIDTLIAEMENHRDDFVVIMAGYTDDMDRLMQSNQGLKSRMPFTVEFPPFSREDLGKIYVSVAKDRFRCEEQLFDAARKYFMELPDELLASKEFSNARFVRNLFERTWAKAAMRCQLTGKAEVVLLKEDFDRAIGEKDFAFDIPKKPRLGF